MAAKNATARAVRARLELQLKQKEEMGEVLHVVDFEQLKIENEQYVERMGAKNAELKDIKVTTGRLIQSLNEAKEKLSATVAAGAALRRAIGEKAALAKRTRVDGRYTRKQVGAAAKTLKALQAEQADVEQPQVLEYIKAKHGVAELEHAAGEWRRKIELAELELSQTATMVRRVAGSGSASGLSPNSRGSSFGISSR